MKSHLAIDNRPKDRKPWHLHGQESRVAEYRDERHLSWEHIAVLLNASKNGVIGAYRRHQKQTAEALTDPGSVPQPATGQEEVTP